MPLRSVAADDLIAGEVANSGRLLALAVNPERRDDGRFRFAQNGTERITGWIVLSPSGEDDGIVDVIQFVFKWQTSRLDVIYLGGNPKKQIYWFRIELNLDLI